MKEYLDIDLDVSLCNDESVGLLVGGVTKGVGGVTLPSNNVKLRYASISSYSLRC